MELGDTRDLKKVIARRLRQTRVALDLKQYEFADATGLGRVTYNQFETGKRQISVAAAISIAMRFGVTTDWILLGDPSGLPLDLFNKMRASAWATTSSP